VPGIQLESIAHEDGFSAGSSVSFKQDKIPKSAFGFNIYTLPSRKREALQPGEKMIVFPIVDAIEPLFLSVGGNVTHIRGRKLTGA
jgi:hypothetical protein